MLKKIVVVLVGLNYASGLAAMAIGQTGLEIQFSGYGSIGVSKAQLGNENIRTVNLSPLTTLMTGNQILVPVLPLGNLVPTPIVTSPEVFSREANTINGVSRRYNFANQINLALQSNLLVNDNLSFTTQIVATGNHLETGSNEFSPFMNYAYAKYVFKNDNTYLQAGQMRLPAFLASEYSQVGQLQPWAALPDMYTILPEAIANVTALKLRHNMLFGDRVLAIEGFTGSTDRTITNDNNRVIGTQKYVTGINITASNDWLTLRAAGITAISEINISNEDNIRTQLGKISAATSNAPQAAKVNADYYAQQLNMDNKRNVIFALSAAIEKNKFLFMSEYAQVKFKQTLFDKSAWYATLGYNIGKFLPTLSIGGVKSRASTKAQGLINLLQDPANQGWQDLAGNRLERGGNLAVADIAKTYIVKYKTYALDVNYMLNTDWTFKGQIKRVRTDKNGSNDTLAQNNKSFNLYRFNVSFAI